MGREATRSVRRRRRLLTALVLLAVLSPALRDHDSFPLSTYPMYAGTRPDTVALPAVVGIDASGSPTHLSLETVAQTDDPLIGEAVVEQSIGAGPAASLALCTEIAERAPVEVVRIEVVTERRDLAARARDHESLVDRTVHASCEVAR